MSENTLTCRDENTEAVKVIKETAKDLVGRGIIHSRDDIIRHLFGANFDITGVTEDSITVCAPDEPDNTVTLSGWLFSERFRTGQDKRYSGDGGPLTDSVRSEGSVGS